MSYILLSNCSEKKIGLITTLNINIGDEFIRDGIVYALEKAFPGIKFNYLMVHKHDQFAFYKYGHLLKFIKRGKNILTKTLGPSNVLNQCEVIIQCGAPIYWSNCSNTKSWQHHLWYRVLNQYRGVKPILNIGGGSSFRYTDIVNNDVSVSSSDRAYINYCLELSDITTVRDRLAQKITERLGHRLPLLPCPAFLTGLNIGGAKARSGEYVVVNYMEIAGHYTYGMQINSQKWKKVLVECVNRISDAAHKIVILCHNKEEEELAQATFKGFKIVLPKNRHEYLQVAAKAKAGICNRMHCSVVLASLGVPSIAIGNDTRLLMVAELGLPIFFVNKINSDELYNLTQQIIIDKQFGDKMASLQKDTLDQYVNILSSSLSL